MAILSESEIQGLKNDIAEIVRDNVISTSISYYKSGTTVSTWNPLNQTIPDMWTISGVSVFKGSYSRKEQEESSLLEMGDIKFIAMVSDIDGILSVDDMIVESATTLQSATTYMVKDIKFDPLQISYFFQARTI